MTIIEVELIVNFFTNFPQRIAAYKNFGTDDEKFHLFLLAI